jgi:hypothetical protein
MYLLCIGKYDSCTEKLLSGFQPYGIIIMGPTFRGTCCLHHEDTSETSVYLYQTVRRNIPEDISKIRKKFAWQKFNAACYTTLKWNQINIFVD